MKKFLIVLAILFMSASAMAAPVGTSSAIVKVYKAYASTSGLCTNPVTFFDASTDTTTYPNGYSEVNFNDPNNSIGSGSLADGTYNCVIFKMSDSITFVPDADEGTQCVAGVSVTMDVCGVFFEGDSMTITNPEDGSTTNCSNDEDILYVYISTYSTSTEGAQDQQAFAPPTSNGDATNGFNLSSPMIVSDNGTGTFTFGTSGKVQTQQMSEAIYRCGMEPPNFGFAFTE